MSEQKAITEMFDNISSHYDFLNHLFSFQIDKIWRRKTSLLVAEQHPRTILDVATGTADLAIRLAKDNPTAQITGIDLSEKMMERGKAKIEKKRLGQRIRLETSDASKMPFEDGTFDTVTTAFGVRNFTDREGGLREMVRVCRDGGMVVVLEFSHPKSPLIATPYRWYSKALLPWLGKLISKHPTAYHYLPTSVAAFPESDAVVAMLKDAGLHHVEAQPLSGGIATLYHGTVAKSDSKVQ